VPAQDRRNGQGRAPKPATGNLTTGFRKTERAGMDVRMNPDWLAQVYLATDRLFVTRLGPEISTAAKAYCPVFFGQHSTAGETSRQIAQSLGTPIPGGALRDSIRFFLRIHALIVMATGSDERSYAAWVELGHAVVVFGKSMGYRKGPSPFLRPALYTVRGG
jgi:hypothetical protein